jgi:hypothetical protein
MWSQPHSNLVTGDLPLLLAGPVLRRTEARRVNVWVATSREVDVQGVVIRAGQQNAGPMGSGRATSHRLGDRLWVHLATLEPNSAPFPSNELLCYDLTLEEPGRRWRLDSLGLTKGPARVGYDRHVLPTFFIADRVSNVMHGSCRLLHGGGRDALAAADEWLRTCTEDFNRRPSALFLTGDQIYADQVSSPMLSHLRPLANLVAGVRDATSVPGLPDLSESGPDHRGRLRELARFTSDAADNHLATFGEFAAMHLVAWNHEVWPVMFPPSTGRRRVRTAAARAAAARARYHAHVQRLERARAALPAVRRVLANTPTYMNFDDHDVTDDWNLTQLWRDRVWASPTGRRVVSNALAAFWAFQGWGNDPNLFDSVFRRTVSGYLEGSGDVDGAEFDATLWSFDRWSFTVPTNPPVVVLDTRTQRTYDSSEGAARLIGPKEHRRVVKLAHAAGHLPENPLIVVSAVPVFGFEFQERRQKYLVDRIGPYEIDFEAWHSNLEGLIDFMELLVNDLRPSFCILLSGDVHYGVTARGTFSIGDRKLHFAQLVSSAQKHAGPAARSSLNLAGRLLRPRHERLGWRSPPECTRPAPFANRILFRAVNTDEWDEAAPVFLAPADVRLLGIEAAPDYRDNRLYMRPRRGSSFLVGNNNLGLVSLRGDEITHRLLTPDGRARERVTTMKARAT